ncbi:cupredoxin domain-containing protein [Noviherbaspirillum malthae]|jgi:plastocyanin|uniref:cupredoxin domain-containing protein n=1 Tax=Noviherbaspirillum malthae TaxID=1260987 RepID=UPI00188FC50C|nr:cupredoxin family copper-binding protein [Noviherbaspirillum malthae]
MNGLVLACRYGWPLHGRALAAVAASAAALAAFLCPMASHAQPPAAVHTVRIEAMQFSPASLEVRAGDRIVWKNADPFPHTATSVDRKFDSGNMTAEKTWTWTAKQKGVYPYICTLHPGMKGVVTVK